MKNQIEVNMDLREKLEESDSVKFSHSGNKYDGLVEEVSKDSFTCRVHTVDNIGQRIDNDSSQVMIVTKEVFKSIDLEWFDEYRGCDNSSIGAAGSWSTCLQREAA